VDGRQVAAALVLGAQGVVIGTALTVAKESRLPPHKKQAILSAGSQAAAIPSASCCAIPSPLAPLSAGSELGLCGCKVAWSRRQFASPMSCQRRTQARQCVRKCSIKLALSASGRTAGPSMWTAGPSETISLTALEPPASSR
jgi:hypothetical protein